MFILYRENEVSMCHFEEKYVRLKNISVWHRRLQNYLKNDPKLIQNGPKAIPTWSQIFPPPIPIPIPGVSNSLLPGDKQIRTKHMFDGSIFYKKYTHEL